MKKILVASLLMISAVASFAAGTTLQKTGKVFFRPSSDSWGTVFYVSVGCEVMATGGIVHSDADKQLEFNEKTQWHEIAVKDVLPSSDDTAFCIYAKEEYYDEVTVKDYEFGKVENLYIIGGDKYFNYSEIKVPTVFWKAPDSWQGKKLDNERLVQDTVDGWFRVSKDGLVTPKLFYVVDTTGYKDTSLNELVRESQLMECAFYSEAGADLDYYGCGFYANILDTVGIDTVASTDPDNPLYYYTLKVAEKIPLLDTVFVDSLVKENFWNITEDVSDTTYTEVGYSKFKIDGGYADMLDIVDTVKIDSTDWLVTHDDEDIFYTLRVRSIKTSRKVVGREIGLSFVIVTRETQILDRKFIGRTMYNASIYYQGINANFNLTAFESDTVYIMEDPLNKGKTMVTYKKPSVQVLFVKLPSSMDWFSAVPMLSFDEGKTGKLMTPSENFCRWHQAAFVNEDLSSMKGLIYFANDTSLSQGIKAGSTTPIVLKDLFAKGDTVYLDAAKGTYGIEAPDIDAANCTVPLTGIVYDTDVSLNKFFSVYVYSEVPTTTPNDETNEYTEACVGVHHGIVQDTLDKNSKPILNKGSESAATCFADDEKAFNTLFNYTKGVNEGSCYTFELYQWTDGRWGYTSDNEVTMLTSYGPLYGGFYPVDDTTGKKVFTDPLPAARTMRLADGPTIVDSLPKGISSLEKVCNGPGWDGGIECEGLFVSDDPGAVMWNWVISPVGTERWTGIEHNQHFCFESHASFVYRKGQNFTAIGDDDIWVFFAGKLAIDNGGTHLATPGYVDLSKITDKKGDKLVEGETYDFDMFFCDRRTTMSNMTFKTNIYLSQKERAALLDPCKIESKEFFTDSSSTKPGSDKKDDRTKVAAGTAWNYVIMPYGRTLQIAGGKLADKYTVFDMQGNMVRSGELSAGITNVQMPVAGSYIVKIGSQTKTFSVK